MSDRWEEILGVGEKLVDDFRKVSGQISSSARGILSSEAFFILATSHPFLPENIIESGRAQGQSTYLLGKTFPNSNIFSIEHDRSHPDAAVALERLADFTNVHCLFGNSMVIIPEISAEDDMLVIDGPKDMKALMLAAIVCRKHRPRYIYIHDAHKGSILRNYLDKRRFKCLYSDEPRYLQKFCFLDDWRDKETLDFWSNPKNYPNEKVYGGTFACMDISSLHFSRVEMIKISLLKLKHNLAMSFKKRLSPDYEVKHPCA
ncbi:MAG: hypothetical protein HOH25_02765 [Opitutae bacterium]|jgi:hypothetical protein|nr:hypothetical protein [Opitutae bacterium]